MSLQKRKAPKGFTLIELVIVIAVIAILAALLVPTILNQTERARVSRAKGEVAEIAKALSRMRTDTGSSAAACYTTLANLNSTTPVAACAVNGTTPPVCTAQNTGHICWNGPYMNAPVSNDPWDKTYQVTYTTPAGGTLGMIQVISGGPNGKIDYTTTTDCNLPAGDDDICAIQ